MTSCLQAEEPGGVRRKQRWRRGTLTHLSELTCAVWKLLREAPRRTPRSSAGPTDAPEQSPQDSAPPPRPLT